MTIDADVLLKEVRRKQRQFRATIFWRDVREVGVALLSVPLWIYLGRELHRHWTWYLAIPAFLWIAGFMLADRIRQQRRQPKPGNALRECIESSLAQVNHQIWLLKNVFWWYLLPIAAALGISIYYSTWHARHSGFPVIIVEVISALVVALVYCGVYWLNQFAVRKYLEPRRQKLKMLLTGLNENSH